MTPSEQLSPSLNVKERQEFASEIKYWIPRELGDEVRDWARHHLAPDPYGGGDFGDSYRTSSLYFDTPTFDVLRKTGSFGRSKYRIRRYGAYEGVFLERKMKTRDLVSKRRSVIVAADLSRLERAPARGWDGHWFHRRIEARALHPVCQITYHRTARIGTGAFGPVRLTMDQDVRALATNSLAFAPPDEGTVLSDGHVILELKYRRSVPAVFEQLIETFRLEPQAVSKYRLASAASGCVAGWKPAAEESAA